MQNTLYDIFVEIEKDTAILSANGENFNGILEKPDRLSYKKVPTLPEAYDKIFSSLFEAKEQDDKTITVSFDTPIVITLPVDLDEDIVPEFVKVLFYNELSHQYALAGEKGGEVSDD